MADVANKLLAWFDAHKRDLPWRRTRDAYSVWVSEMMLQQTQIATVIPYYERWMARFPDVGALARASEDEVLHAWQGLGYYSRAKNLLRGARAVMERHAGRVPADPDELRALPGIGPYSAGAIASIAHGRAVPLVDGNVVRVLCRLYALGGDPSRAPLKQTLQDTAARLVPADRPGDFNQALMELGQAVCTPRAPDCARCPLKRSCQARAQGVVDRLPETAKRPKTTPVHRVAAIAERRGRFLVAQEPDGLWRFPNATVERGETAIAALARVGAKPRGLLISVRHAVTRYRITLDAYRCTLPARTGGSWKAPDELEALAMPAAHRRIAQVLTPSPPAKAAAPRARRGAASAPGAGARPRSASSRRS